MDNVMTSDFWEKHIKEKIGPEKASQLDRIVLAGMKVMFSKETHQMLLDEIQGDKPMKDKLAEGIAKLMILLFQQSNKTMPTDLIIPAGGILMARAVEFLVRTGEAVTEDDFAEGMSQMVKIILKQAGASDEQINQAAQGAAQDVRQTAEPNGILRG